MLGPNKVVVVVVDAADQRGRTAHLPPLATCPEAVIQGSSRSSSHSLFKPLIQEILLRQRRKTSCRVMIERYTAIMQSPMSMFCNA